jgi:hypothetical protein
MLIFSLGKYTTAFQAEVYTIKVCAEKNFDWGIGMETSVFYLTVKMQIK